MFRRTSGYFSAPDRLALGAALFLTMGLAVFDAMVLLAVGTASYLAFDLELLQWSGVMILGFTLPIWMLAWIAKGITSLTSEKSSDVSDERRSQVLRLFEKSWEQSSQAIHRLPGH